MKKNLLSMLFAVAVSIAIVSCGDNDTKDNSTESKDTATLTYTCPMHPEVITHAPGTCPKCGMDLEKKDGTKTMEMKPDSMMKSDSAMKM